MNIYDKVNSNLRDDLYRPWMADKKKRTGSPKGQSKPRKHAPDPGFQERFARAASSRGLSDPELARLVGCDRMTINNYRNVPNKAPEAALIFPLADALKVSARWLLTGEGEMTLEEMNRDVAAIAKMASSMPEEIQRTYRKLGASLLEPDSDHKPDKKAG